LDVVVELGSSLAMNLGQLGFWALMGAGIRNL
jgi:hypothetical protein